MEDINALSHQRTVRKVFDLVTARNISRLRVLDLGAGEGYFTRMLGEHLKKTAPGSRPADVLSACDLKPELFRYADVPCDRVDANAGLPYDDGSFDAVCCIEVIEHVENQFHLVRELFRVTKPGGRVFVTTPNVLNLNSRIRQFHSGFAELCNPLPLAADNPLGGHIHPVGFYYLAYMFRRAGFRETLVHFDRVKSSAAALAVLFYVPIVVGDFLFRLRRSRRDAAVFAENRELLRHTNCWGMLTARTLILEGGK